MRVTDLGESSNYNSEIAESNADALKFNVNFPKSIAIAISTGIAGKSQKFREKVRFQFQFSTEWFG